MKLFGLHIFDKEACDYFINIIKNEVERRNKDNLTRGDFLDLLIAMKHDADLMKMNVQNDNNNHIMGHSTIQTSVGKFHHLEVLAIEMEKFNESP